MGEYVLIRNVITVRTVYSSQVRWT